MPPHRRKKRPAHRPTLYNETVKAKLCEAIAMGDTTDEACKRVGVGRSTFFEWQQNRPDFLDAVEAAKLKRLEVLEEAWARTARKDWKAAQAMLRALKPKKFAERINVHVESELEAAMKALHGAFADEPELLERALTALAGGHRPAGAGGAEEREGGDGAEGGEAVRAAPAEPEAAGVPGAGRG